MVHRFARLSGEVVSDLCVCGNGKALADSSVFTMFALRVRFRWGFLL